MELHYVSSQLFLTKLNRLFTVRELCIALRQSQSKHSYLPLVRDTNK